MIDHHRPNLQPPGPAHRQSRSESLALAGLLIACLLTAPAAALSQTRGISLEARPTPINTPYVAGHYRALIIGNDRYDDPNRQWKSLKTAVRDARAVAEVLRESYGFDDVELLENANRREILQAFDALARRVLPNDSVLVYYAGHGWLDRNNGRGYWIPVDADGSDPTSYLRNSTIRDELELIANRSRHTLLIADSCFSGSLLRSGTRGITAGPRDHAYYEKVANRRSVQILAAGGLEYVDDSYGDSGHSPFTYFLLNELKDNGSPLLTASELGDNVSRAVANNVEQTPASGVLHGAGDELGEFIFLNIRVKVPVDGRSAATVESVELEPTGTPRTQTDAPPAAPSPARVLPLPTL